MALEKITQSDLANKGVIGLEDTPALSTLAMQEKLDELATDVLVPKFNALIDDLESTDGGKGADAIGFDVAASGLDSANVGGALREVKRDLDNATFAAGNVVAGGTVGQIYRKKSTADFDAEWVDNNAATKFEATAELTASWVGIDRVSAHTTVSEGTAEVDEEACLAELPDTGVYTFTCSVTAVDPEAEEPEYVTSWQYDGEEISLIDYGITLTGTPADADTITVVYALVPPFTQDVAVAGMTVDDHPHVVPVYSADYETRQAQREAWACITDLDSGADKITFTCDEEKPETAIPIIIEVVR